ncbi:MAG TPA: hypothetical protein VN893_25750 [Bryobacteraceae bacterium]|nr:hypothetical protein [Bryobacteraceae bacterium]
MKTSEGGAVWVSTVYRNGLSRLESGHWRFYSGSEVGADDYASAGFAVDGDALWAAGGNSVVRFEGGRWLRYRGTGIQDAVSVAASGGQAWVLDISGAVAHFNGQTWGTTKVGLPDLEWDRSSVRWARLARTPDGALWLAYGGVWRFDGTNWQSVSPAGDKLKWSALFGVARDRLWFEDGDLVETVSIDRAVWSRYTPADIGLPSSTRAAAVAQGADVTWLATSAGLVVFDGTRWQRVPPPEPGAVRITSVAAGPRGSVWVVATREARGLSHFAGPTAGLIIWAAALWIMIAVLRRQAPAR